MRNSFTYHKKNGTLVEKGYAICCKDYVIGGYVGALRKCYQQIILVKDMRIKSNTKKGYEDISEEKFVLDTSYPASTTRRGRVQQEGKQAPALTCSSENNLRIVEQKTKNKMESYRIRKLTERECFRLMGVRDEDIDKLMQSGISRSQLYKMAGNSIVCDVLMGIFNKMFVDNKPEYGQQLTLF